LRLNGTHRIGPADPPLRGGRAGLLACAGAFAGFALYVFLTLSGDASSLFGISLYHATMVAATVLCAARGLAAPIERAPWALLAAALGLWTAGDLYYTFAFRHAEAVPFPSFADALYLAFYPVAYAGLGLLLLRRVEKFHGSLWLDGAIGGLVVSAVGAAVVFDAVVATTGGPALVVATNLAYPLLDLLLLGLLVGVIALTGWRLDRGWLFVVAGICLFGIADTMYLYETAVGTYTEGQLTDVGWVGAAVFLAAAAWSPAHKIPEVRRESWQVLALPTIFASIALGLLVYDHYHRLNPLAIGLATASLAAVIVRTVLTFREKLELLGRSQEEALTDSLTSLGNRRRFMLDIERDLEVADVRHPLVLVLFDLDGFKNYNDTYGHPAGDALLVRLSTNLEQAVGGQGRAYRMGGDEFCVLASAAHVGPGALISTAASALTAEGEGFAISCSYGTVLLPEEADRVSDALRIADGRMYVHKNRHRPTAGRQSMDVLLRLLNEHQHGLHLAGVADLVEAVGRRLRVPAEQLETLRQAAEVHDIGKIAIPEQILMKPGPLTDEEWDFIRRHPLIGERILAAAPALGQVARLVRSTHERWDGTGYPDKLKGQEIPLGARIIAVCEAFDAMISERPHTAVLTVAEALRELLRCSGTQFDPEVVEAFNAVYTELRTELVA
jgi:two-component system, cell cycle response regulator